ncbi:MAG: riboflavin kinase [Clostridia bacterium]|nr:riboflavin kinase [Clostridia bacterium]
MKKGGVASARVMLGRPFSLSGRVARGRGVGRKMSFPTANMTPREGMLIPKKGVYATVVNTGGKEYAAVTNVGARPTFGGGEVTVESHLTDFSGDLYGKKMTVRFIERIRDERRFENAEALARQIEKDISSARGYLSKEGVL